MSVENRVQILHGLITEYQLATTRKESGKIFGEVLSQVDLLILKIIHKMRRSEFYLLRVNFSDLYQTGILGLHEAMVTMRVNNPSEKIIPRIIAYVKSTIRTKFKYARKEFAIGDKYTFEKARFYEDNSISKFEFRDLLVDLYKKDLIDDSILDLIYRRFTLRETYEEMGAHYGVCGMASYLRLKKALNIIRIQYNKY